jgi:hypothetical protein
MRHVLAALVLLSLGGSAAAGPYRSCAISAYVIDQDAKGMNIRAAPAANARVVKVVDGPTAGTTLVRGFQDGWFRISEIDAAEEETVMFRGDGWVHASRLHVDVAAADPNLWEGPTRRSKLLKRLAGDQEGVTLVACSGNWAQVRVNGVLGWLSPAGQCSNPLTTCA